MRTCTCTIMYFFAIVERISTYQLIHRDVSDPICACTLGKRRRSTMSTSSSCRSLGFVTRPLRFQVTGINVASTDQLPVDGTRERFARRTNANTRFRAQTRSEQQLLTTSSRPGGTFHFDFSTEERYVETEFSDTDDLSQSIMVIDFHGSKKVYRRGFFIFYSQDPTMEAAGWKFRHEVKQREGSMVRVICETVLVQRGVLDYVEVDARTRWQILIHERTTSLLSVYSLRLFREETVRGIGGCSCHLPKEDLALVIWIFKLSFLSGNRQ